MAYHVKLRKLIIVFGVLFIAGGVSPAWSFDLGGMVNQIKKEVDKTNVQPANPTPPTPSPQPQQTLPNGKLENQNTTAPKPIAVSEAKELTLDNIVNSLKPTEFGFKEYKIGQKKSEIKNLAKCINTKELDQCFPTEQDASIPALNISGKKTTIAGQDALINTFAFIKERLIMIQLHLPVPNPRTMPQQIEALEEALSSKYELWERNQDVISWKDKNNSNNAILLSISEKKVNYSIVPFIRLEFVNLKLLEHAGKIIEAAEVKKADDEKKKKASDL